MSAVLEAPEITLLNVNYADLRTAVDFLTKVVKTHTSIPILSHIQFTGSSDGLTLRATDLETSVEFEVGIAGYDYTGIAFTLPARDLLDFLKASVGDSVITFSIDGFNVGARSGFNTRTMQSLPHDEYPAAPAPPKILQWARFSLRELINALDYANANSTEEARGWVLMGVNLTFGSSVKVVATDGYRLAQTEITPIEQGEEEKGDNRVIVPGSTAALLRKIKQGKVDRIIDVDVHPLGITFTVVDLGVTIYSRTVDGTYPNTDQVIPAKFDRIIDVDTAAFQGLIKAATLASNSRASMVILDVHSESQTLTASATNSIDGGRFEGTIPVDFRGDDLKVSFNGEYVQKAIAAYVKAKISKITISSLGPVSPAKFSAQDESLRFGILMPLRQ